MKKIILVTISSLILMGCATAYPKVEGEKMRVYLTNNKTKAPVIDPCFYQVVPTRYEGLIIVTDTKILEMAFNKKDVKYLRANNKSEILELTWLSTKYQEALEEGITEYICTDKKRLDADILHDTGYNKCPIIRESVYTKTDKEFLEIFKNEVLLGEYLEIPQKLGIKIYNSKFPDIKYTKEILEQAMVAPNRAICIAMPLKTNTAGDAPPGMFFKSYPTEKERKNMLKDKDPNIYWEYEHWGGFFNSDGTINQELQKKIKAASKSED